MTDTLLNIAYYTHHHMFQLIQYSEYSAEVNSPRAAIDPTHINFCTKTQITLTARRKEVEKEAH